MFQTKVVDKIKTHILCSVTFFFRIRCPLCDGVENTVEPDRPQIIRRTRVACWITKATDTHSEYAILTAFDGNNCYANAPQYYVNNTVAVC